MTTPGAGASDAYDAYDRWAATYDSDTNVTRDLDAIVLRASTLDFDGRDVLELGCGTGKNTVWLAERARSVTAIDFSPRMMSLARERVGGRENVRFIRHDVRDRLPCDDASVDVVVGNLVLEHVKDVAPVFAEAARVLRVGGQAFFCELHPERQGRGSQAQFTDTATGERVFVEAYAHTVAEFERGLSAAGLSVVALTSHLEAGAAIDAPPRLLAMLSSRA